MNFLTLLLSLLVVLCSVMSIAVALDDGDRNLGVNIDVNPRKNRRMELMLPTRDGTYLHTVIILPRETDEVTKFTAIVDRSPYGIKI